MNRKNILGLFLVGMVILSIASVHAEDCQIDFYFQKVEEVIDLRSNQPEPTHWWDKAKNWVKQGIQYAKMAISQVKLRFFPSEGEFYVVSTKDPNIVYKVRTVKVKDEAHLKELIGGDKATSDQKRLLEAYQYSKSDAVKKLMPYHPKKSVKAVLTDLTKYQDDPTHGSRIKDDFWPMSLGSIQMNTSSGDPQSTFLHEFAHTLDATIPGGLITESVKTLRNGQGILYGKDMRHSGNEVTTQRVAYMEGWAEFNQLLAEPSRVSGMESALKTVQTEDSNGKYTPHDADGSDLTGIDLLKVEGINALVLYKIAKLQDGNETKVFEAFAASNKSSHDLSTFLKKFLELNPAQAAQVGEILDAQTWGKLSDADLLDYLGSSQGVKDFLKTRSEKKAAAAEPQTATPSDNLGSATPVAPVSVDQKGTTPFSAE